MVAGAGDICPFIAGDIDRYWWRLSNCTIYLYLILKKLMLEKNIYKNILVIVIGLLSIDYIFNVKYLTFIAYSIGVLSVLIPPVAFGTDWVWMKLALVLGWINSRILLTLIFFLILVPIALLRRVFGNSALQLDRNQETVFKSRNHLYRKEDLSETW